MASNRKLDEKHLKILREMVHQGSNKECFDCGQRGPTYVNVTIGAFICTHCSGILRGLNPPQRVKSISMATFTPEEIETLQARGNEYCRQVWLGSFSERESKPDSSSETRLKEHLIAKYERKKWYVDPSRIPKSVSAPIVPEGKKEEVASRPAETPGAGVSTRGLLTSSQSVSQPRAAPLVSLVEGLGSLDIGGHRVPAAASMPAFGASNASQSSGDSGFADFENASIPPPVSSSIGVSSVSPVPFFPMSTHSPSSTAGPPPAHAPQPLFNSSSSTSQADKYAALADLDEVFRVSTAPPAATSAPPASATATQGTGSFWGSSSQPVSTNQSSLFSPPSTGFASSAFQTTSVFSTSPKTRPTNTGFSTAGFGSAFAPDMGGAFSSPPPNFSNGFGQMGGAHTSIASTMSTSSNPFVTASPSPPVDRFGDSSTLGAPPSQPVPIKSTNPFLTHTSDTHADINGLGQSPGAWGQAPLGWRQADPFATAPMTTGVGKTEATAAAAANKKYDFDWSRVTNLRQPQAPSPAGGSSMDQAFVNPFL